MTNRGPLIIAILVLLLPVLYVGSYLALVDPPRTSHNAVRREMWDVANYRGQQYWRGRAGDVMETLFWPIEQIDRKLRPKIWGEDLFG